MVLDSGADHPGINAHAAEVLGLTPNQARRRVAAGCDRHRRAVPTVRIERFTVGDMEIWHLGYCRSSPIRWAAPMASSVPMRCRTDAYWWTSVATRSSSCALYNTRAAAGFRTIPFRSIRGNLVAVDATVGGMSYHGNHRHRRPGHDCQPGAATCAGDSDGRRLHRRGLGPDYRRDHRCSGRGTPRLTPPLLME